MEITTYCFMCRNPITELKPRVNAEVELEEGSLFSSLVKIFSLSSLTREDRFGSVKNSEFCSTCELKIDEVMMLFERIKSFQLEAAVIKGELQTRLVSAYSKEDYKCGESTETTQSFNLGKMLAQCWSKCSIVVPRLTDEEVSNSKKTRSRSRSRTPGKRIRKNSVATSATVEYLELDNSAGTEEQENAPEILEDDIDTDSDFPEPIQDVPSDSSDKPSTTSSKRVRSRRFHRNNLERRTEALENSEADSFSCPHCDKVFPKKNELKHHLEEVHNQHNSALCKHCGVDLSVEGRIREGETLPPGPNLPFICRLNGCNRRYKTSSLLRTHHSAKCPQNPAMQNRTHTCDQCGKTYTQSNWLRYHINDVHEQNFKFCCEICGKGFQLKSKFDRHVQGVHSAEKRFQCEICEMKFKRPQQLVNHRRTHTGERPYVCEFCGKDFHVKGLLQAHTRNVHSNEQFPCPICAKLFPSKHYVHNHVMSTHMRSRASHGSKGKSDQVKEASNNHEPQPENPSELVGAEAEPTIPQHVQLPWLQTLMARAPESVPAPVNF